MASHTIAQICGLDSTKNFFAPFVNSSAVINPLSGSDFKSPGLPDVSCSILEFRAVVRARWFFFLSVRFPISRAFPRYSASIASSGFESSQQEWCFSFFAGTGCVHRRLPGGPDFEVDAVPEAYAALALIGGLSWCSDAALGFAPLVEDCRRQGSVLGGICDAVAFLARLGTLNHARHTANDLADLKRWCGSACAGEAFFTARQAVRDKNIATANGTAPLEFAREMLMALEAAPEEKIRGGMIFTSWAFTPRPCQRFAAR